jgi:hypothetical protein
MGRSFMQKVYSEKFMGTTSLESLNVIEYHDDTSRRTMQTTPAIIRATSFFFFIIATS